MKKRAVLLGLCLLLAGCGNVAQPTTAQNATEAVEETFMETVAETETETVEESTKTNETMTEEETATEEAASEEVATEETVTEDSEAEKPKEVTEKVTIFDQPKTMYATIGLNVRRGPGKKYEVVSHLAVAQAVEITGQAENGWYQMIVDGVPAYASNKYLSETKVEVPAQAPLQQAAVPMVPTTAVAPAGVIMVGDSRCVQMQAAVGGGGCSWVCENSKEYTWFSEVAIPKFDQYVGYGTKVVINMGVNDPEHYKQYAELINAKAAEWSLRGAKTYLVSVNPVWENPYTTQEQVDTFNANIPGMLVGVTWIDTSTWLNLNGYRLLDGLHYDDPTYVNIFNLIIGSL